jgi:nicotinate-nucleotide adenylyltransferase
MKIGIYGGSFNPIHFGHTGLAQWVVNNTDLDEVWLMVSPNNPLKDASILADEQKRLAAAKETIGDGRLASGKRIIVSDFEFTLPRPNYTANTLRELQKQYPQHEFTLIIGEDNLEIFPKWREYTYLLENFRILVYPRKGSKKSVEQMMQELGTAHIKEVQLLANAPYFEISSTELRKNLHN